MPTPLRARLERLRRPDGRGPALPRDGAACPEAPAPQALEAARAPAHRRPFPQAGRVPASPGAAQPAPGGGPESLRNLERSLLGATSEGLALRERLERLVRVTAGRRPEPPRPRATPLEELVQGRRVENERGEFFLVDTDLPLESFHGQLSLSRLRVLSPDSVQVLSGESELGDFDLSAAAFLDTETTGLAGGTGTAAFLIGVGFVDGERFRVRQYFMRDYHEEAALLAGLAHDLGRFRRLVTFNGKMFDVPLLEARYRLNRLHFPMQGVPHLDLLHPARRLWRTRLDSCRLQVLETELLGLRRRGDLPGALVPQVYFDYVRRRDARALLAVFRHNTTDVVSLAALAIFGCQWLHGDLADDPRDLLSLGRVLERARLHERSEASYRRVLASSSSGLRVAALLRLAARARHDGRTTEAVELWEEAAAAGDWFALRALAVHHEHRGRDPARALALVERALALLGTGGGLALRARGDFERRRRRLLRRLAARA